MSVRELASLPRVRLAWSPARVRAFLLIGGLLVLEVLCRGGWIPATILTAPTGIALQAVALIAGGDLWPNLGRTLGEIVAAFVLASLAGLALGTIFWRIPYLGRITEPYLISMYAMPTVFFYPLLLALFGLGPEPVILLAGVMSVIPIALNTAVGLRSVRPIFFRVGRNLGLSRSQFFRLILVPAAAPYVFTGLKIGLVYAVIGSIAMEFIVTDVGLGYQVSYNYNYFDTPVMYAYILFNVLLAVAANALIGLAERRLRGWHA